MTLDEFVAKLRSFQTLYELADWLRMNNYTGFRRSSTNCPIARACKALCGDSPSVGLDISIDDPHSYGSRICKPTPDVAIDFIATFDGGGYSELSSTP